MVSKCFKCYGNEGRNKNIIHARKELTVKETALEGGKRSYLLESERVGWEKERKKSMFWRTDPKEL